MITLQADNRQLTSPNSISKYSFLNTNYPVSASTFFVLNATDTDFTTGAALLLGDMGSESTEIVYISTVNNATGEINITGNTLFAHSESTRVTILPYDKISFYYYPTLLNPFDIGTATPLVTFAPLQVNDWYTTYNDDAHSSGYGWYLFYSTKTTSYSQPSTSIPYTGFNQNTTEDLISDFFSLLSNKELRLVTREDALSWASEGYSKLRNKLNISNVEYTASELTSLSIIAGQTEYDLPTDFDHLISITSGLDQSNPGATANFFKASIDYIPLREAFNYKGSETRYYIRGFKIGFLPTPTASATYNYIYLKKAQRLSSNNDEIDLPNNGIYVIKDWMMYRAMNKFQNFQQAPTFYKNFNDGMNEMIVAAIKRDANLDTFGIDPRANV